MEKYVPKSALVAEIERRLEKIANASSEGNRELSAIHGAQQYELINLVQYINTLKVKEDVVSTDTPSPNSLKISRHGNSHIEAMTEALRMEYEKGRADVLRCIDPDEMVADFCSQPLSKTRSLASIYRQGITDILRKINNNEENSITGTCSINDCGM
jgi:hypothetical protein